MTENDQPFSEEAALRALEGLQREIEQSRLRRKDATEAFDRFLRSFDRREPTAPPIVRDTPPVPARPDLDDTLVSGPLPRASAGPALTWPPPELPSHPADVTDPEAPTLLALPHADSQESLRLDAWGPHTEPSAATADFHSESDIHSMTLAAASAEATAVNTLPRPAPAVPAALRTAAPRTSRGIPPVVPVLVLVLIAGAAFFGWRFRSRDAQASAEPVAAPVAAPQPAAAAPPPAVAPTPAAEVSTVRRVWVRVLVDGQKVLEQELPPDARIPLTPTSQVVVRAGDAGAVRVSIAGKDQGPVGRDGEVATRQFKVAAPPAR